MDAKNKISWDFAKTGKIFSLENGKLNKNQPN